MVYPDAQARELDGKRPSQEVLDRMAYGCRCLTAVAVYSYANIFCSEVNLHAMRLGPGKHLKGLSLFNGLVKPEEVSLVVFFLEMVFMIYFLLPVRLLPRGGWTVTWESQATFLRASEQLIITQEMIRTGARGYSDGTNQSLLVSIFPDWSGFFRPTWW